MSETREDRAKAIDRAMRKDEVIEALLDAQDSLAESEAELDPVPAWLQAAGPRTKALVGELSARGIDDVQSVAMAHLVDMRTRLGNPHLLAEELKASHERYGGV